jgi:SAM-dependent methyltransferase
MTLSDEDHLAWWKSEGKALSLEKQQEWWDGAASANAKSAILSEKQSWDTDEFFASGVAWWTEQRNFAASHGVTLSGRTALDFGCGIGRMTCALTSDYETVTGVDISAKMLEQAASHPKTQFIQAASYPLPFPDRSFDLVHSSLVVQHISHPHSLEYLREFFRLSRGQILFDVPVGERGQVVDQGMYTVSAADVRECGETANFELAGSVHLRREPYEHVRFLFVCKTAEDQPHSPSLLQSVTQKIRRIWPG